MDYDVQRCTRHCHVSDRELAPGEEYFSALVPEGGDVVRLDYSTDAWPGPPENAIGWWKSKIPDRSSQRKHWAPNDVMLQFFDELSEQPDRPDMRYVLALLMVRRRVFRLEEGEPDQPGDETLVVYCPRRETTYQVPVVVPDATRAQQIQDELAKLLE